MGPAPTTTGGQWLGAEPEIQILSKILFFILRAVKSRFMGFFLALSFSSPGWDPIAGRRERGPGTGGEGVVGDA